VLASLDVLEIPLDKVNTGGGALAFGHPYGASGAVLVTRLFTRLVRNRTTRGSGRGLALIGAAGGLGVAALFEAAA
jgi:acetyl-CoA C-acetyltransferase